MALSDVITAIQADFTARSVVLASPITLGNVEPNKNGTTPRIACRATSDTFKEPLSVGGNQPSHKTRNCGCEVHLWGETVAATETILNEFLVSLQNVAPLHELRDGAWNNQVGFEAFGFEYVLNFRVEVPAAVESAYVTVPIETFVANAKIKTRLTETSEEHIIPPP